MQARAQSFSRAVLSFVFFAVVLLSSSQADAQVDIFEDDFESGDCASWSSVQTTAFIDDDGDGYTNGTVTLDSCVYPKGFTATSLGADCDDLDAEAFPGAASNEPSLCTVDLDSDGWGDDNPSPGVDAGSDCNDGDPNIHPSAVEVCDDLDNNCDTITDNDIPPEANPLNPNQLGACSGTRQTCNGGSYSVDYSDVPGFGLAESPNADYLDENCDGLDGTVSDSVFVAGSGVDSGTCTDPQSPCASPDYAVTQAINNFKLDVLIQAGSYTAPSTITSAVRFYGGYDTNWVRDQRDDIDHQVILTGPASAPYVGMRIQGTAVTVADLFVVSQTAAGSLSSGAGIGSGNSSYGLHVENATVMVERATLQAGSGAAGSNGSNGTSGGAATAAMNGGHGGNASQFMTSCNSTSRGAGGTKGTSTCSADGGAGGPGGTMDESCPANLAAQPGTKGLAATVFTLNGAGDGGAGGAPEAAGQPGFNGTNGASGGGGPGGAIKGISNSFWYAQAGASGEVGGHGTGGGGGGGSGGADEGTDAYGAGGGGGAAGGCRAPSAGTGGAGGGGSFGVFGISSTIHVVDSLIIRGLGGTGGNGGAPASGQPGGSGGDGGVGAGAALEGGDGGDGGDGGSSGGGGGGVGGDSYGIYTFDSSVTESGNTFQSGNAGGAGQPTSGTGSAGSAGSAGTLGDVGTCSSVSDC